MSAARSPPRARRAGAALFAATVLVAATAAGMLVYRFAGRERPAVYAAQGLTAAAPAPEHAQPPEPSPSSIPAQLPEISLPAPDGVVHRLREWQGRPLLVNFWATWCEPCRREIPLLETLRHERAGDRLEVVGIALDTTDAVLKYMPSHGIDYPVLVGEKGGLAAVLAFGMEPLLPFSVFADHHGEVVALKVGELHRDEAELILDRLRDVDAGKLAVQAARSQISAGIRDLGLARAARDAASGR